MAIDKQKQNIRDARWKKNNTAFFGVRFTNKSGVPDAIRKYSQDNETTVRQTVKISILEKLTREGYWKEGDDNRNSDEVEDSE